MKNILWVLLSFTTLIFVSSCVDRDFDAPPVLEATDPDIDESDIISIADVKAMKSGDFTQLSLDKYIRATIVADDETGNFFKSLVLQDETGGITILLDDVELWNSYYIGRRVFVDLRRVWLGEFNGLPQLGFEPYLDNSNRETMARIPAAEISGVVLRGSDTGTPQPALKSIATLALSDLNTLVRLEDVEFATGSANAPYAVSATSTGVNHTLQDCSSGSVIVRTSVFSSFGEELTPAGNGEIVGIYGIFGSDKQILIRDLDDVNMEGDRCDGTSIGPIEVDESKVVSIQSILDLRVDGEETNIGTESFLKATVVSSDETRNFFKTIVVQDETGGIAILVDDVGTYVDYVIGADVFVALQDLYVSEFNGVPQLGYAPSTSNVKRIPEGLVRNIVINAGTVGFASTTALTLDNLSERNLNTYVSFEDVEFDDDSVGNTYADGVNEVSGNNTLVDCDGNELILRTSGFADFADDRVSGANGTIKGVLQTYQGTYQLVINYPEDVNFQDDRCDGTNGGTGTGGGGGDELFSLDFETQEEFDDIEAEGWINVSGKGNRVWKKEEFSGNGFAQATAFQDDEPETEAWLISPVINTSEKSSLSFLSSMAFYRHDGLNLVYTTNYTGDVNSTSWTNIDNVRLATDSDGNYTWVQSGDVDLTSLGSEIRIAFQYEGTSGGNTTTFRLDDIVIE